MEGVHLAAERDYSIGKTVAGPTMSLYGGWAVRSDCVNWCTRRGSLLSCLRVCCMVRKEMALCGSALIGLNRTVIRISTHLIFLALPQLPFSMAVRRVAVALAEAVVHCVEAIAFEKYNNSSTELIPERFKQL